MEIINKMWVQVTVNQDLYEKMLKSNDVRSVVEEERVVVEEERVVVEDDVEEVEEVKKTRRCRFFNIFNTTELWSL